MTPTTQYGIPDDEGEVIRWVWSKPSASYQYVTKRVKPEPAVDWSNIEPAPY